MVSKVFFQCKGFQLTYLSLTSLLFKFPKFMQLSSEKSALPPFPLCPLSFPFFPFPLQIALCMSPVATKLPKGDIGLPFYSFVCRSVCLLAFNNFKTFDQIWLDFDGIAHRTVTCCLLDTVSRPARWTYVMTYFFLPG